MQRRRGAFLEGQLLSDAWSELCANGYANFSMDAVAIRSKTSRPVLYRRWPNRADLAIAAMRHHFHSNPLPVPDTGSLRGDLIKLLKAFVERGTAHAVSLTLQMGQLHEETGKSLADIREEVMSGTESRLNSVLLRAVARGEIDASKLSPRIMSLPADLLRHEVMMTLRPVSQAVIEEIIDDIFLPLVQTKKATKDKKAS